MFLSPKNISAYLFELQQEIKVLKKQGLFILFFDLFTLACIPMFLIFVITFTVKICIDCLFK